MTINPTNLWYFLIALPISIFFSFFISKLYKKEEENNLLIIISLSILLFFVRLLLVFFADTIGIMPYIKEDLLFYPLLLAFGLLFTGFYVQKIEKKKLKDIGFEIDNRVKSFLFGFLGIFLLLGMTPVLILLTGIKLTQNINIFLEKVIIAICFGLLGAIYEEVMFRGVIQNHISQHISKNYRIGLYTAIIFTLTHLFYLPFIGFGIYYIFVFMMALLLSWLRIKSGLIACAFTHGGIVFILIILV
ncbi:MAG: CPBP family intramembrane metalloprotease [Candidatus Lokiarchaeota archaeon]|nr:CPBP family intramembrane metalloprotease [Candidatus Lokiarchaeota archaeon]MBD3340955.1 CPBP family intramembrane metalloprotease [Candidatus Lokiarchaeota archaeon]